MDMIEKLTRFLLRGAYRGTILAAIENYNRQGGIIIIFILFFIITSLLDLRMPFDLS
jgi:hypothetical protein